jgi:predicted Ser/Thr protein kinase
MDEIDKLYDSWRDARRRGLTVAEHARELGLRPDELGRLLEGLLDIESAMPASSLAGESLAEGVVFGGFRLLRWLGEGGTGVVYMARDERSGSAGGTVALKVVNPLLSAVAERRELLLHEARVAKRLAHPGIVAMLDCGVERGWAWIAMELVEGRRMDELGELSEQRALRLAAKVARAIAHAHSHGIVHRDLKPGNVLVVAGDEVKVLDFGLARNLLDTRQHSASGLVGTPLYMAPEQMHGREPTGPATDVHAIGLLLHDMLRVRGEPTPAALAAHAMRLAQGRRALGWRAIASLPRRARRIVEQCTRASVADRPASAEGLATMLERAAEGALPPVDWPRLARSSARRLLRSKLVVLGIPTALSTALVGWRCGPVPVEFDLVRSGKQVWIDGVDHGTTPLRTWLTPGRHEWKARFGSGGPWMAGTVDVAPGRTNRFLEVLQPIHGVPWIESIGVGDDDAGAWVQVSTPLDTIDLSVDGSEAMPVPGIAAFRLAPGLHHLILSAPRHRPRQIEFAIVADRLHAFSFELDLLDDPWTTTLAYSAMDEPVRQATRRVEGAKLVWESGPVGASGIHAERVYWAPNRAREAATVDLEFQLPAGWTELDLELLHGPQYTGSEAWSTVAMGPGFDSMVEIARYSSTGIRDWSKEATDASNVHTVRPPERLMRELATRLNGANRLCVRLGAGGAPAPSSTVAWAQMLRCELLPLRVAGRELQWAPAMRIKTR